MKQPDPAAIHAVGDKLAEMAQRVIVADKCSPGSVGRFEIALDGKPLEVTVRVMR